jgi:hypothetical protein
MHSRTKALRASCSRAIGLRCPPTNLTLQYDKVMFILEPNDITRPLARQRVTVIDYPDGRLAIRHKGVNLPYPILFTKFTNSGLKCLS